MNEFYVYQYADPITLIPFYIGKGKNKRAYDRLSKGWVAVSKQKKEGSKK